MKVATSKEHLAALGWHVFPQVCGQQELSVLTPFFDALPSKIVKRLAGRGMHLASLTRWSNFVLGNFAKLPACEPGPPLIRCSEDEDHLDEDNL